LAALLVLVSIAGCSSARPHLAPSRSAAQTRLSGPSASTSAPLVLRARALSYAPPGGPAHVQRRGQLVPASAVTDRIKLAGRSWVGLANARSYVGRVYMAISHDGGRRWRVDSPEFYLAGAHGPEWTDALVRTRRGLVAAWGQGGNFVKITLDAGRSWYQTDFPDGVDTVKVTGDELVVRELQFTANGAQLPDLTYTSTANGRTWHLAQHR
jgi:hypothetical protein